MLRLYFFSGYVGLDDAEYTRFAFWVAQGELGFAGYEGPAVFPLRVGVYYPVALLLATAGLSEWSVAAYPLLLSLLALLLVYFCAANLFDRRVGLIAAAIYAILPLDVLDATVLLPDLPAALFASAGVVAILAAMRSQVESRGRLFALGAVAGLAFGVSWLCKETVAYFVLTCMVLMVLSLRESRRRALPLWGGVSVGALAVLLGESMVYAAVAGDWLFRVHEIERNYQQWPNGFFREGSAFGWEQGGSRAVALVKRLFISGPRHVLLNDLYLYLPLAAVVACLWALYWRDKAFWLAGVWLFTLLLMFNFASSSVSTYAPLPLFNRYFYPILFPATILTAALLGRLLLDRGDGDSRVPKERRFWGALAACALVGLAAETLYWAARPPLTWTAEVRALRDRITPSTALYSDTLTLRALEFFHGYPHETRWVDFASLDSTSSIPSGSLVLVNSAYLGWLERNTGMWLNNVDGYPRHDFYERPPATWEKLLEVRRAVLYAAK